MSSDGIIKVYGAAGTGKTTYLQNILVDKANKKYDNILYISFSNAAIDSMYNKLQLPKKSMKTLRTLHSLCYRFAASYSDTLYNGVQTRQALQNLRSKFGFIDGEYMRFCAKNRIPFSSDDTQLEEGNLALTTWQLIVSEYYPKYESIDTCMSILSKYDHKLHGILEKWQQWKKATQTVDWIDLEIHAYDNEMDTSQLGFTNCNMVMMDEAQDFSRLEWHLVDRLIENMPCTYLAGDDCQTIYDFKGANASFFLNHEQDKEIILPKSYRLPSTILDFSKKIVNLMHEKKVKNISPACEGGEVEVIKSHYTVNEILQKILPHLAQRKSVFVLFRTNAQAVQFREICIRKRLLPKNLKTSASAKFWNKDLPIICSALNKLREGGKLDAEEWIILLKYIKNKRNEDNISNIIKILQKGTIPLELYTIGRKYNWIELLKDTENRQLTKFLKKEEYKHALMHGLVPVNLYVDTIHASKGLEADVVVYVDALTETIQKVLSIEGKTAIDDELRVAYVGCTRARECLYVIPMKGYPSFLTRYLNG